MKILIGIAVLLILWSLWGYFSSNVEQAQYSVLSTTDDYEIRVYAPHIVAQTTVDGSYEEALNKGFTIIANYIFGGNVKKEGIAMTAPVTSQKLDSEKIAMTAPVTARAEGNTQVIAFVMPQSYTLDSLPTPNDSRVKLVAMPAQKMAVMRFSWGRSGDRVKKMEAQLLAALARDKVTTIGAPSFAGYNAPWTPPWMIRNEVMIAVE